MKIFQNISSVKRYVLNSYPTLENIKKINYLGKSSINSTNFLISTKHDKFVLHNFLINVKPHRIRKICQILNYCHENGAKVPFPYLNKLKNYVDQKKNVYLTNYYSGTFFNGSNTELKSLATEISKFHKILKKNPYNYNYKLDTKYKLLNNIEINKIKNLINKKIKKNSIDSLFNKNYTLLEDCIQDCKKNKSNIEKITRKKQIIHGDLHPKNIIFEKNKVKSILDFEQLRLGNPLEDIAFASFRFSYNKSSEPKKIKKQLDIFLCSYQLHNQLNVVKPIQFARIFQYEIFGLISYILREKYFFNSELWIHDFNKFIRLQKLHKKTMSIM